MSTSIITASYNNAITVSFTNDAWFNATAVAKQFGRRTEKYLSTNSTKEYIVELHNELFPENPITLKSVIEQNQLVRVKVGSPENGGGSWFHPELAVDFARWLSPRFAIWCDRQIKKILKGEPVQRDFVNEPLKIPFATKEQREPLVRAVRRLVSVASEKGKSISYENAHSIINLKMGVSSVEELTLEQIPQAMALVGDILERVVLEGEFIAKGEAESVVQAEETPVVEKITNKQYQTIRDLIYKIQDCCKHEGGAKWAIEEAIAKQYLARPKDLAVKDYDSVINQLSVIHEMAKQHHDLIVQADKNFIKCVLREGRFALSKQQYGLSA